MQFLEPVGLGLLKEDFEPGGDAAIFQSSTCVFQYSRTASTAGSD
jgi:hypothetical protein